MQKKIFLSRRIPRAGMDLLKTSGFLTDIHEHDDPLPPKALRERVKDVHGLICLLDDRIDRSLMDAAPKLEVISNSAVGFNNIDIDHARSRNIAVCNPRHPDRNHGRTRLGPAFCRSAPHPGIRCLCAGRKIHGWKPMLMLGSDIHDKALGVIGTGRIGTAFALRSKGFNMRILYSGKPNPVLDRELGAENVGLETLLRESDFISLHIPMRKSNYHLLGKKEFSMMKDSACLINTARGPVVDEAALVEALRAREIAGAGLDVYEHEPELTPGLKALTNVVLTPHTGSASTSTRDAMATMAVENCLNVLRGEKCGNRVV
ncbi:MAG: D-glycerate dehydrogenase [Candidatus Marinimicrobia bacterium]|nr:D-glycerate dehydrogenase [Candidatus Neomarinimicrobiota bacterium]